MVHIKTFDPAIKLIEFEYFLIDSFQIEIVQKWF